MSDKQHKAIRLADELDSLASEYLSPSDPPELDAAIDEALKGDEK